MSRGLAGAASSRVSIHGTSSGAGARPSTPPPPGRRFKPVNAPEPVPSAPSSLPVNSPAGPFPTSVRVSVTCEPLTEPLTALIPQVPLTVSPVVSRVTCAYTGSRRLGLETSATHLPAISAAVAPQGQIQAPTKTIIAIERISIVFDLLCFLTRLCLPPQITVKTFGCTVRLRSISKHRKI